MFFKASGLFVLVVICSTCAVANDPTTTASPQMSSQDLANWIDAQFEATWNSAKITPPSVADDATFLKRIFLDLNGTLPSVSQAREFLDYEGDHKRDILIDRLLTETRRPEKLSERTAAHWATLWRRMMVPGNTREAQQAIALEPWLKEQFATNVPYDEIARKLITAANDGMPMPANPRMAQGSGPAVFIQATGGKPQTTASAVSRIFLGVRVGCAECHDHPFAKWKKKDFWGMAAFFNGSPRIKPENFDEEYVATFLDGGPAKISAGKTSQQVLADWMVAKDNPMFAATFVNRVWMNLLGRGLTESVDDLDKASPAERKVLDELARKFVEAKFDVRWLIGGICKSQVYQRECVGMEETDVEPPPGFRVVKTLIPEQVFNSLEQALALPIARADGGARFNGLRDQLLSRMNEAATNQPADFRAGIPQALLLMNGRITTEATDLDQSRTLRGVLDAPFLNTEEKLSTLYLAVLSRAPRTDEREFLMEHVAKHAGADKQGQAYAEIFWSLLNSPEFVLEK